LGSRFLPATKAQPKEMLPIVDKPLIQYAVEEAVAAGITEMIFITGRNKRAIEDHFDKAYELEAELEAAGKDELLKLVRGVIPKNINCIYIRQSEPLGLGHAVLCARPVIGNEPFAVLLADDFMDTDAGQAGAGADDRPVRASAAACWRCRTCRARTRASTASSAPATAQPGNWCTASSRSRSRTWRRRRWRWSAAMCCRADLRLPGNLGTGAGGEIQLTDGIAALMKDERVLAYRYDGQRYDCGSKLGYLKAMTAMGLKHPETGDGIRRFLADTMRYSRLTEADHEQYVKS
jgi:UTP--glucose-1-phosphate uridylyltransferase